MGENIENTTKTIDSQEQTPFDSLTNESKAREDDHSQEQTPFDSLVNEPETREDGRVEEVRKKIELYIQTELDNCIENYYDYPEDIEEYEGMLRELANSSPDDDNIWTQAQKDSQRELFELVQQLDSLKHDQPQINPDNEETQEPKSRIEIINKQIEEYIQKELDSAKDERGSSDDDRINKYVQKLNELLRKLANSRSDDDMWTSSAKELHPELFKLVVEKEIESYIQSQLIYAENYSESPEDIAEYEDTLRKLANSSPDDDIWTPKQKAFQEELFDLVQQLEPLKHDQPQINPDNEETQEPKSHIEIINERIEECIQEELDYAKDKHKSPDDEYEQKLRKLANSRSGDAIWTNWAKVFRPKLFELVVKKEIELYIQTQLVYADDYYESPEDIEEYEDMLRELANSSPDDDIWTPKQKAFHEELFGLVQRLVN